MLKRKMISSEPIDDVRVYKIPSRNEYSKNSLAGDVTWDELYGKKKCYVCNEHFEEGDEYVAEASVRKRKRWVMPCRHATCDPANPPKRTRHKKTEAVDEDDEDTKKIYTDVEEKIGETLLLHGKVMTIVDKDSDDEGDYIVVEETEDDDEDDEGDD